MPYATIDKSKEAIFSSLISLFPLMFYSTENIFEEYSWLSLQKS